MAQVGGIVTARLFEVVRSAPRNQRKLLGILDRSLNDDRLETLAVMDNALPSVYVRQPEVVKALAD